MKKTSESLKVTLVLAFLLAVPYVAHAQPKGVDSVGLDMMEEKNRQFDFWIGEWDMLENNQVSCVYNHVILVWHRD